MVLFDNFKGVDKGFFRLWISEKLLKKKNGYLFYRVCEGRDIW